jgi:hypothetical protein
MIELFSKRGGPSARRVHSLAWVFDAFEHDPGYLPGRMFGSLTAYLDGRLCLSVTDRGGEWNGLLVCTVHEHHASLMQEIPALRPHQVLGKWLYVAQDDPRFEDTVDHIVSLAQARDERIGIEAKPPRSRRRASGV